LMVPSVLVTTVILDCIACSSGSFGTGGIFTNGSSEQIDSCRSCPEGQFQNTTQQGSCLSCPFGKIAASRGSVVCQDCPPGYYGDGMRAVCQSCPAGKYQSNAGQLSCEDCDDGKIAFASGSITCADCPAGYYANEGHISAFSCPVPSSGTYGSVTTEHAAFVCANGRLSLAQNRKIFGMMV
jgi:hypothetical protein